MKKAVTLEKLRTFIDYIIVNFCQGKVCDNLKKSVGNEITSLVGNGEISRDLPTTNEVFVKFLATGIMTKIDEKYYIVGDDIVNKNLTIQMYNTLGHRRLSWINIQRIGEKYTATESLEILKLVQLIKWAFWAFRKGIVDSMISNLLDDKVKAYGTGSTNITSDYDITLSGANKSVFSVINNFTRVFKNLFLETSGDLFDTNLYGKSFIKYKDEEGFVGIKCKGNDVFYKKYNSSCNKSQFIWALLHCFRSIHTVYGRELTDILWDELEKSNAANRMFVKASSQLFDYLENQNINYMDTLANDEILKYADIHKVIQEFDNISLSNYYANEAYYTYGAFVDVVVNQQICSTSTVPMNIHTRTQSILDNLGFYILHPVEKYAKRINRNLESFTLTEQEGTKSGFDKSLDDIVSKRRQAILILKEHVRRYNVNEQFESESDKEEVDNESSPTDSGYGSPSKTVFSSLNRVGTMMRKKTIRL
jgi:hypothetical protein